ncbi:WD repeat and HMG-box DNA-binding protein 1-like, partial [Amphibalanus amphitrite]|uniref:WD repeat and HMG-box DNA-binding protein 1-like n=1 Tax=Amphibalanus amphitrite TaxID=1232801 RepID=UPI001C921CD9
ELDGFGAPVLSVALSPSAAVLLTTCCDGKVTFWDAGSGRRLAAHALLAVSNDVSTAPSPARPSWSPDGRSAVVPVGDGVRLFGGDDWSERRRLSSELITRPVTACAFSPCGRFVAAATADGLLLEWRLAGDGPARQLDRHEGRLRVNALCWHPDGDRLAFTDNAGQLGVTSNVRAGRATAPAAAADPDALMDIDSLQDAIDDDDDRDLLEAALDGEKNTLDDPKLIDDDDEEDDNVISLRKIKAESGFLSDADGEATDGATEARPSAAPAAAPPAPVPRGPAFAEPQPAFQPGSTPAHLERRFMVWNAVGVVTAHEADSIDVEFHDSAVHHPLHLRNTLGHTLAALSERALLLAAPAQDDAPAKLQCLHFSSWDSNKEWYLDLADGEEPEAVALGADWLAVATSRRLLRVLTLTGVQLRVLSLCGRPVCLAGWEDRLLVVHHAGTGLPGEQSLAAQLLSAAGRRPPSLAPAPVPVPLAPQSRLVWAGFSDQGTPCVADSSGALRLLTGRQGAAWTPLEAPHPGADHLFVVGVSELEQTARGLLCRGSRYPAVLPRPVLSVLPLRLPLAEADSARGKLEEEAARARLLLDTLSRLDAAGFETEEAAVEPRRARAAALTQLFALAVRTDREHRALDVAAQMEQVATVEAVAGYASRQRRAVLAQRLMELAQTLADAPDDDDEPEPATEDWAPRAAAERAPSERVAEPERVPRRAQTPDQLSEGEEEEGGEEGPPPVPVLPEIAEKSGDAVSRSDIAPGRLTPCNPFKCQPAKPATQAGKGAAVFDDIKRQEAPVKRTLPEGKAARGGVKPKRPRVSKDAAGKLGSIKSAFAPKPRVEKENLESEKCETSDVSENSTKSAPKVGSGLAKLSAFAFTEK